MAIRQEYEETLEFLVKHAEGGAIAIPLVLSAGEWRCLFQDIQLPLRLKLHAAMLEQRRLWEERRKQQEQAPPVPNWGWYD